MIPQNKVSAFKEKSKQNIDASARSILKRNDMSPDDISGQKN